MICPPGRALCVGQGRGDDVESIDDAVAADVRQHGPGDSDHVRGRVRVADPVDGAHEVAAQAHLFGIAEAGEAHAGLVGIAQDVGRQLANRGQAYGGRAGAQGGQHGGGDERGQHDGEADPHKYLSTRSRKRV